MTRPTKDHDIKNFGIKDIDPDSICTIRVLLGYKYQLISNEILDAIAVEFKDILIEQNPTYVLLGL